MSNESNGDGKETVQEVESLNEEFKYSIIEEAKNSGSSLLFTSPIPLLITIFLNLLLG